MTDEIHYGVIVSTRIVANTPTLDELIAINTAAQLGTDPTHVMGYDKASPLFTENQGTQMHRDTRTVLNAIVNERLAKESE